MSLYFSQRAVTIESMKHLSKSELEELHDALLAEKAVLESELSEHGRRVNGDWQGTAQGMETSESDTVDSADKMEELAINIPLVETLEKQLKEVTDALTRMKSGSYGTDENTGEPIPTERLRVNPSSRVNVQ